MTNTDMSLRDAAQAVIDRWETPLWKDAPATAAFIADLRDALARDAGRASLQFPGFTAADMATASAQGFRDGVASVSAGSEPVAWQYRSVRDKGLWFDCTEERAQQRAAHPDKWDVRYLYTHPSPPEGMAGWTTLPGQMPEPNTPVLLDIGKKFPIRALWAEKHTVRVVADVDDWGEYDEETDEYYCPEGWYEWHEHEEVHWAVSEETPRAWRELPPTLPAAPGPADGESNELC